MSAHSTSLVLERSGTLQRLWVPIGVTVALLCSTLSTLGAGPMLAADARGGEPVVIDTAALDQLEGQAVDIAPWAYAWRADRTVQEKPEACFIPRCAFAHRHRVPAGSGSGGRRSDEEPVLRHA